MMGVKRQWTPEEDRQMLAWAAEGMRHSAIGERLDSSHRAIDKRLQVLTGKAPAKPTPAKSVQPAALAALAAPAHPHKPGGRKCLHCGRAFASAHAGNRICPRCRYRRDATSPYDPR